MDAEKWKKVKSVLEQALDVSSAERQKFLDERCSGDNIIRSEVETFLRAEHDSAQFERSAVEAVLDAISGDDGHSHIDEVIGKYRMVREIGAGGMGAVYLAERADGEFTQRVAIKLIRAGVSSDAVLRRFLNERQILASLEHPNIARLIDGGSTDDSSPYLVMEYVEGTPINEYVDERKLGLEERLDLFRMVCAAVAFAHRNLVIHRDLKPSNILVTKDGKPKLLDFGIAKLVSSDISGEAVTRHFAFTPEYASPEQILGENLTTATDIYSLGVILYEMLAGSRPFCHNGRSVGEIFRSAGIEPARPSSPRTGEPNEIGVRTSFRSQLRGDLDNIVLKALKKEPERRYSSVEQLSEDVRRHLKGLPVLARQDTLRYRAEKFTRRNPLVVASAALTIVILLGGIIATAYQARLANIERTKAEQRFNEVRSLANSFIFEVNEKIDESPIKARELVVTRAIDYLDKLAAESANDPGLQSELAAAYEKVGEIQAEIFKPNLGNAGGALESQKKALQLRLALFGADRSNPERAIDLARSHQQIGGIVTVTGDIAAAAEQFRASIALISPLAVSGSTGIEARKQLRSAYLSLGQSILRSGSLTDSLENYTQAFDINEGLLAEEADNENSMRAKFIVLNYIGYVRMVMGDNNRAIEDLRASLSIAEQLHHDDPTDMRFRRAVVSGHSFLGLGLSQGGYPNEGIENLGTALRLQQGLFALDKQNLAERNSLADCYIEMARAQLKVRRSTAAIRSLQNAETHYSVVSASDPADLSVRRQLLAVHRMLAEAEFQLGRIDNALTGFRAARVSAVDLTSRDPNNREWQYDLTLCNLSIGKILKIRNEASASEYIRNAETALQDLVAVSPQNVEFAHSLEEARSY